MILKMDDDVKNNCDNNDEHQCDIDGYISKCLFS